MDINSLLQQLIGSTNASNANIDQQSKLYNSAIDTQKEGLAELNTMAQSQGVVAGIAAQRDAEIKFKQNQQLQAATAMLGLNPDDVNNEIAQSVARLNSAQQARKHELFNYQQLQSVDFMSNPVGYILAQLKAPGVVQRHNALAAVENDAAQNIEARTSLLKSINTTVAANVADDIRSQQLVQARADSMAADMKRKELEMNSSSKIATMYLQAAQFEDKKNDNKRQAIGMMISAEQVKASREATAMSRAVIDAEKQRKALTDKEKDAELQKLNDSIKLVGTAIGRPGMNLTTLQTIKDKKMLELWSYAAQNKVFGPDLQGAVEFVTKQGNMNMIMQGNPGTAVFLTKVQEGVTAERKLIKAQALAGGPKLTEDQEIAAAYASYQDKLRRSAGDPETATPLNNRAWDDKLNPYKADFQAMSGVEAVKDNALMKAANVIGVRTGEQETTAIKSVMAQVSQGTLTPQQASREITQFYRNAAKRNIETYAYNLAGMPVQTSYMIVLPAEGWSGRPIAFDGMNPTSTEAAIAQAIALERAGSFGAAMSQVNNNVFNTAPVGRAIAGQLDIGNSAAVKRAQEAFNLK